MLPRKAKPRAIVFCDFDGTISEHNTLVHILKNFAKDFDPKMEEKLVRGEITLSRGVRYFLEHIPSSSYRAILEFSRKVVPRPGLEEFLLLLKELNIPFIILSGGLAFVCREVMSKYGDLVADVRAVEIDRSGRFFSVIAPYDDGNELVAKKLVVKEYEFDYLICIGDGETDHRIIEDADFIFACDDLAVYLKKKGIPFQQFEDFFDIHKEISSWE